MLRLIRRPVFLIGVTDPVAIQNTRAEFAGDLHSAVAGPALYALTARVKRSIGKVEKRESRYENTWGPTSTQGLNLLPRNTSLQTRENA